MTKSRRRGRVGRMRRLAIYVHDQWKCYLCGIVVRPVDRTGMREVPDDAATLDHVVPVSLGGGNSTVNLRTCCYRCNINKGNQCQGQPRKSGKGIMKALRNRSAASSTA